jgi:hypothetical protein
MMITRAILKGLVCVMVLVPSLQSTCQTTAIGSRSASLAGISAGLEDVWAVANNPAGLAGYNHISLATSLEQRFLMKELGYYALAASIPAGKGCLGIFTMFSGYQSFIDQNVSLGYGRKFGEYVLSGISLVYVYQKAGGEVSPVHQVSYELGAIIVLSKKVSLSFATFNPFQLYFKSQDYATLPAIFKLGLSLKYSPALSIYTECEKDMEFSPCLKIGMEYIYRETFFIRGGIKIFPASYAFGTGLRHNRFLFEFSSSYHQYLGFTPQVSLQYDFK